MYKRESFPRGAVPKGSVTATGDPYSAFSYSMNSPNNWGECHAHSQKPTDFNLTLASKPEYAAFDLTKQTPLLTSKDRDESQKKWDTADTTGVRFDKTVKDVEYHRDIKPIFARSCVA